MWRAGEGCGFIGILCKNHSIKDQSSFSSFTKLILIALAIFIMALKLISALPSNYQALALKHRTL